MSKRRSKWRIRRLRRRLFKIGAVSALFLAFLLVFRLRVVIVSGSLHEKPEEITEILLERPCLQNTVLTALLNSGRTLEREGFIDTIRVKILARDRIRVTVTERVFVGCVESGGEYWYFDSSGRVTAKAEARISGEPIPPVTGLTLRGDPEMYEVLPAVNTKSFSMLAMLRSSVDDAPQMLPDLVEFDGSAMTLSYGDVSVLMGTGEKLELRLRQLRGVLPELLDGYKGTLHLENYDGSQNGIVFDTAE